MKFCKVEFLAWLILNCEAIVLITEWHMLHNIVSPPKQSIGLMLLKLQAYLLLCYCCLFHNYTSYTLLKVSEIILTVIMFWWVCRNPLAQMEEEKRDHEAKMKKMESEMEQVFEMKVREKKQKLKDSEADVSLCNQYVMDH